MFYFADIRTIRINLSFKNLISVNKNNTINEVDENNSKVVIIFVAKKNQYLAKFIILQVIEMSCNLRFLIFKARLVFIQLRQVFIEVLISQHFNLEWYILIKTDILSYTIGKV